MERDSVHRNFFYAAVVQLVPFAQEVRALLGIADYRDHAVWCVHNSVHAQRADLQAALARRKIFCRVGLGFLTPNQGFKRIAPRRFLALEPRQATLLLLFRNGPGARFLDTGLAAGFAAGVAAGVARPPLVLAAPPAAAPARASRSRPL